MSTARSPPPCPSTSSRSARTPTTSSSAAAGRSPLSRRAASRSGSSTSRAGRWRRAGRPRRAPRKPPTRRAILGARFRVNLDLGDGDLRTDRAAQLHVVEAVRRARPRLVLAPLTEDRHPDHERAGRLVPRGGVVRGAREARDRPPAAPPRPGRLLRGVRAPSRRRSSSTCRRRSRRSSRRSARTGASSTIRARLRRAGDVRLVEGLLRRRSRRARAPTGGSRTWRTRRGSSRTRRPTLADPAAAFAGYEGGRGREDRDHVLPDVRRLRRRRDGARARARAARARRPLHHLRDAVAAERLRGPRDVPRGHGPLVSALPVRALRPRARDAHGRRRDSRGAGPHPRPLRAPARHLGAPRARDARPAQARPRHDAPRHGRDDRRARTARTSRSRASGSRSPTRSPRCPST